MHPTSRLLFIPALLLLLGCEEPPPDIDRIQGSWTVEASERGGKKEPPEKLKQMRAVFERNSLQIIIRDKPAESVTVKLDPSKSPKTIDLQSGPIGYKSPANGIYELDGDTLKLCWRKDGGQRPTEFATRPDDRDNVLMILKRQKRGQMSISE